MGVCAMGLMTPPSPAWADPDSAFFSQPMSDEEAQQVQGPWKDSAINVPQITSSSASGVQASSVDLASICAGQGGALGGVTASVQALNPVLSVPNNVVGSGGVGQLFQGGGVAGGGGVSPGALGASATGGVLGALGMGGH